MRPHLAYDSSCETGKVFVLVDGSGERTMITDRGAGEALNPDDLPAQLFRRTDHLHLSGYVLCGSSRRETALEALRLAREAGMSVSVDPSSVPLLKAVGPERFLEWTRGVDLCFPNLQEGSLLGGAGDPGRILDRLVTRYPRGGPEARRAGRHARERGRGAYAPPGDAGAGRGHDGRRGRPVRGVPRRVALGRIGGRRAASRREARGAGGATHGRASGDLSVAEASKTRAGRPRSMLAFFLATSRRDDPP